jgi:hypothetical protein
VRTPEGEPIPPNTLAELQRDLTRNWGRCPKASREGTRGNGYVWPGRERYGTVVRVRTMARNLYHRSVLAWILSK